MKKWLLFVLVTGLCFGILGCADISNKKEHNWDKFKFGMTRYEVESAEGNDFEVLDESAWRMDYIKPRKFAGIDMLLFFEFDDDNNELESYGYTKDYNDTKETADEYISDYNSAVSFLENKYGEPETKDFPESLYGYEYKPFSTEWFKFCIYSTEWLVNDMRIVVSLEKYDTIRLDIFCMEQE